MREVNVLSLGAGIQSTTLLVMSCKGVLPKLDAVVFADTGFERSATYKHLEKLKDISQGAGIPLYIVDGGNMRMDIIESKKYSKEKVIKSWGVMPMYRITKDGKEAMLRRQCTQRYKIRPIERCLKYNILGLKKGCSAPDNIKVNMWLGISMDEVQRIRMSKDYWINNTYPLIGIPHNFLEKNFTRTDCVNWLKENFDKNPVPRSACIACPYQSNLEWRNIKMNYPKDFGQAVEIEQIIKTGDPETWPAGDVFLHRKCKTLDQIDFRSAEDKGQSNWINECNGLCGV